VDAWERQPDESAKAFDAFAAYRDQGARRSIRTVAHTVGKSATLIARWSKRHDWQVRVATFDSRVDDVKVAVQIAEIEDDAREMARRHINQAKLIQQRALEILRIDPTRRGETLKLSTIDAMRGLEIAQRLERLATGQSTENVAANVHTGPAGNGGVERVPLALDPESADLANALIRRLGGRTPVTAGSALDLEQSSVGGA
jgi:hypothetical protein